MHLQEWYDDDNEDYDANELKTATKEEHDSLQKTNVFTRVRAQDYDQQQLKEVIQTNINEIYAATPATITLRILLTIAQLRNHSIYMSDIQSAFLNTPVQPGTSGPQYLSNHHQNVNKTTTSDGSLTSNSMDYETHHRSFNYTCHQYSSNLVYINYNQISVSTRMMTLRTTTAEARDEARTRTTISLSWTTDNVTD
eukprot:6329826-Amphidinium_carterae.1